MNDRAAALIINDGFLLLMHRRKPGKEYYVLPGGSVEPGESPKAACIREVREETGLAVALERKLLVVENDGRWEHYFLVGPFEGKPGIGQPESGRQSSDNQYALEWVSLQHLDSINLQPSFVRQICMEIA